MNSKNMGKKERFKAAEFKEFLDIEKEECQTSNNWSRNLSYSKSNHAQILSLLHFQPQKQVVSSSLCRHGTSIKGFPTDYLSRGIAYRNPHERSL